MWHFTQSAPSLGWPSWTLLVEVVVGRVVDLALVALQAEGVALPAQLQAVAVVAVAAADAARVHLALQERAVDVDLVAGSGRRRSRGPRAAARAACGRAGRRRCGRSRPARRAASGRARTARPAAGLEIGRGHDQAAVRRSSGRAMGGMLGPGHVPRARAVAGLAADVDVRPGGVVGVGLRVVALSAGSSSGTRRTCRSSSGRCGSSAASRRGGCRCSG